jgi:hypothetical protein
MDLTHLRYSNMAQFARQYGANGEVTGIVVGCPGSLEKVTKATPIDETWHNVSQTRSKQDLVGYGKIR